MLKKLPIALAQVKAGNNSETLLNEIKKLFILCINQKKSLKKYTPTRLTQYNRTAFNYKNGSYTYELRNQ